MNELHLDKTLCILVVDDDVLLNELLCEFLHGKDLQTRSALCFSEAKTELTTGNQIDLVLLDYQLGDGNGLDLIQCLGNEGHSIPPVIMISVNEDPEFLQDCFACGIADYIIKPINLSLLALKVRALINSVAMQKLISVQNAELARFKQEAEREEAVAKFIYEYLLKQNSQHLVGVSTWLQSSASFSGDLAIGRRSPCGDFYLILADATGHGLSAAITIMPVVSIFNSMVAKGFQLQSIVTELNEKLVRDTPQDRFVAAIVVQVRLDQREMSIWNGGMPAASWVKGGVVQQVFRSRHMALGILDDDQFDSTPETLPLPEEGFLFACTDGLLEARDQAGECFSMQRVIDIIQSQPGNLHTELVTALKRYTGRDSFSDDVSLCTLTPSEMLKDSSINMCGSSREIGEALGQFSWGLEISGHQIAECEIPPLANKFLHYLGVDKNICQIVFLIVSEMVSNAIDHGILRLDSTIKENLDGFDLYFREREERLHHLTGEDKVSISLECATIDARQGLTITVKDSGIGYDPKMLEHVQSNLFSGRGLHLIRGLAQSVEVVPPGNLIKVMINSFA